MKFKIYANLFLKIGSNTWKISTLSKYKIIVYKKLNFLFDKDLENIKSSDLKFWLTSQNKSGKTLMDYKSVLNQIFLLAKYDEIIKTNPVDYIKSPKKIKPLIIPFTSKQVSQILNLSKKYPLKFQIFLKIGFFTGARTGEILALKKQNFDFENSVFEICRSRSKFGENIPKTQSSIRKVPIFNIIYNDLFNYVSNLKSEYLFLNQYGKPYNTDFSFTRYFWKPILKSLNIKYQRLYTMRHTFATNILKNGLLSPYELSKILGHSTTEMVYNRYVKFVENQKNDFKLDLDIYQ